MAEKSGKKEEAPVQQTEPQKIDNEEASEKAANAEEIIEVEEVSQSYKGKKILSDAKENIEGSAKVVGETVNELVGKLKKGASEAIKSGSKVVDELSHTANAYTEKYKAEIEVKKLQHQKEKQITKLGAAIYKQYKTAGKVEKTVFTETSISEITGRIAEMDHKVVELGKELDKAEEK